MKPTPASQPLGVADKGIFPDLDDRVRIEIAPRKGAVLELLVDAPRALATLYVDGFPRKIYPLPSRAKLPLAGEALALRPADHRELSALSAVKVRALRVSEVPPPGDADGDGITDPLDILIGAKKTALNAAAYKGGYVKMTYPGGDVPRTEGVCTDVVIRAVRNAGVDLQKELQLDIKRNRRSYPMVRRRDPNINHRRVKTLLPYFVRHFETRNKALDSDADPLLPGDIVFMDTFPSKRGPDHIGIVSERIGASGHPLVINNWTDGSVTAEMDLLDWVPVTHRFRVRPTAHKKRSR